VILQVGDSTAEWFDREHNYSMVVQAVVDSDGRIRDVFTGLPGSVTDSAALRASGLYRRCENGEILNGSVLLLPVSFGLTLISSETSLLQKSRWRKYATVFFQIKILELSNSSVCIFVFF
jgi:hypothetical protein